ncbi:hypothetical protein FUAX_41680 (plasmid) [Fulvitalea axinellae]|uniref:DUF4136 domain-containing protein n=1 Tax=Fulvitalea axinellae TaxID=1182444 RepID=A0AAU9CHV3_9BACT|nr:hypothetical protein FUAX_41680 [Fulvitalea axinellae]
MFNHPKLSFLFAVLMAAALWGCYPDDDRSIAETEVTLTYYDTDFEKDNGFQKYSTFTIRDSVALIKDKDNIIDSTEFYAPGGPSEQLIDSMRQHFIRRGYIEVDRDENPDFAVNATAIATKNVVVGYYPWWNPFYPWYWDWYGGWFPGYTGWYPWYPGYAYSYRTGFLMFEVVDGESMRSYESWHDDNPVIGIQDYQNLELPESARLKFRWQANINGLISTDEEYTLKLAFRGIDEAFEQSPYLAKERK